MEYAKSTRSVKDSFVRSKRISDSILPISCEGLIGIKRGFQQLECIVVEAEIFDDGPICVKTQIQLPLTETLLFSKPKARIT